MKNILLLLLFFFTFLFNAKASNYFPTNKTALADSVTPTISISSDFNITNLCVSATSSESIVLRATTTFAGNAPTYVWKKNNNVFTPSYRINDSTIIILKTNFNSGDNFTCVLTSNESVASPKVITSNIITLTKSTSVYIDTTIVSCQPINFMNATISNSTTTQVQDPQTPCKYYNLTFTLNPTPSAPVITGPVEVCSLVGSSTPTNYSITSPSGRNNYIWSVPPGVNIVSGNGTSSLNVTFTNTLAMTNQRIKVYYDSIPGCTSEVGIFQLSKTIPDIPTISGLASVCPNALTHIKYEAIQTNSNPSITDYLWTVPSTATITSDTSGLGTNIIYVNFSSSFGYGPITAKAMSNCGSRANRSYSISKFNLAVPPIIQKSFNPSTPAVTQLCGVNSETYKIKKMANATAYIWSFNRGANSATNITHESTNQNDTSITVDFLTGFTTDSLLVQAVYNCGVSSSRTIGLSKISIPPTPTNITSSSSSYNACIGDEIIYTVVAGTPSTSQSPSSTFNWSIPRNTKIIDAANDSSFIKLKFNAGYYGGNIGVNARTACGVKGYTKVKGLTHNTTTCGVGNRLIDENKNTFSAFKFMDINISPNPSNTLFNIKATINEPTPVNVKVLDLEGKTINTFIINPNKNFSFGKELKAGTYFIQIQQGRNTTTKKVVKL